MSRRLLADDRVGVHELPVGGDESSNLSNCFEDVVLVGVLFLRVDLVLGVERELRQSLESRKVEVSDYSDSVDVLEDPLVVEDADLDDVRIHQKLSEVPFEVVAFNLLDESRWSSNDECFVFKGEEQESVAHGGRDVEGLVGLEGLLVD